MDLDALLREQLACWRPPPRFRLSEWADAEFRLSSESSAAPGRWTCHPFQREWLDAASDPRVTQISLQKSARLGGTSVLNIVIAGHIDQDPCPILMFQPTVDDARRYSKREIAPMLRDVVCLRGKIAEPKSRESSNTILDKEFPGGSLELNGANSPAGFRARTIRVLIFDEVDGYGRSAGEEGDQIQLGVRRTETFWNRKIIAVSTPASQPSRIEELFLEGDQRRYLVPCPFCDAADELVWQKKPDGSGHWMRWPEGQPERAHFVCSSCEREIGHEHKRQMVRLGRWQAHAPFRGHASFYLWAAYSHAANTTWASIAEEYERARRMPTDDALRVFYNTVLGLSWQLVGDVPEWRRLYERREPYAIGSVPAGVHFLTAGVDVQKDRLVFEVVGWNANRESWSVEADVLVGDTSSEEAPVWAKLDELLSRTWETPAGALPLTMLAIDSGYNTQVVYAWARRHQVSRVMACKGMATAKTLVGTPSPVDFNWRGKKISRGCMLWPVGVSLAKQELYGWLRLDAPTVEGEPYPSGYCHFPEYGDEFFRQLTAEQLVTVRKRTGFTAHEWQVIPGRQNHFLDARVYARAAAARAGLDRMARSSSAAPPPAPPRPPQPSSPPRPQSPSTVAPGRGSWLAPGRVLGSRRGGWFGRR